MIDKKVYSFHGFYLGIQSWVHNYLHNSIRKNRILKRVKRSHLPKLHDAVLIWDTDDCDNSFDRFEVCWLHLLFEFYSHDKITGNLKKYELTYVQ